MLFHSFNTQDERRAFGGSDFLELQFCEHKSGTSIKRIVNKIENWRNDSLYVSGDDMDTFYSFHQDGELIEAEEKIQKQLISAPYADFRARNGQGSALTAVNGIPLRSKL